MNCPTTDKISQYVDHLLTERENNQLKAHIKNCVECARVVATFTAEQEFLKDTLQTPTLPDNFTSLVLDQLEPYETKVIRRKTAWKRIILSVAGVVLAVGIGTVVNPTFAQLIGGMFSTDQVDEGLQVAQEAGLAQRVDLEVVNNGITLKVEDVVADSSRVALSYQVLNRDGKPQDTYLEMADSENEITAIDQNGEFLNRLGTGWQEGSNYGFVEFSLREYEDVEKMTIQFDLVELNGVKGNWHLEVPVDLTETRQLTTALLLNDEKVSHHGVTVALKKLLTAPSSSDLHYETALTEEEQATINKAKQKFETKFGEDNVASMVGEFDTSISYHLENESGKEQHHRTNFYDSTLTPGMMQSEGKALTQLGQVEYIDSFIPKKENSKLTFVLDGVYKTEPSDFSITIKPKEVKKKPVSFEVEGNFMTIKKVKEHNDYSFNKSLKPIGKEKSVVIEIEGGKEAISADLGDWLIVDEKGNVYPAYPSGSILNEKDKNDRFKTKFEFKVVGLKEVPKEFTLHLLSMTRYYPVDEKWSVPLYSKN